MKKFLKILLIVIGVILVILIITPILFKKPIENLVKKQINDNLKAKVDFTDFRLSFLRSFPNVYMAVDNFTIVGVDTFRNDTLLSFKTFSASVNLISAIKMKSIKVKSVLLDNPHVFAKVLANGKVNWDIMKPTPPTTDTTVSEPINFGAELKKFEIRNAFIKYQDDSSKMAAEIQNLDFELSGDFSAKRTDMTIAANAKSLDFIMDGIKYLKQSKVGIKAKLGADLENSIYTIKDNEIKLNDLSMSMDGLVKMPNDTIYTDLKFKTNKADFKSLLSLVPAVYMKDFKSVQTSGSLKLDGYIKGIYAGKTMPSAGLNLVVENAMFKYPSLPKSVNNINIDTKVFYDGAHPDNTTVDVNKFHMDMAGNPFDIILHIKTPMSDMNIDGNFKGRIDFNSIADVIPMDSVTLKGLMESNVSLAGRMSSVEKGRYEDFKADGTIKLQNFEFANPSFPQGVKILTATMLFSPRFVDLSSFDARVGKSDFKLNGKLEKFIPYMFRNDTIVGSLNLTSNLIDVTELMGPETPAKTQQEDTTQLSVIGIPANLNFVFTSKIGQINYDKLKMTNVNGIITVRNSKAVLKNLGMNLLQGSMTMNGEYNTQNIKIPTFNFNLNMKDIDIPSAYTAFNTVQKLAPVAKNCKGSISADLNIASALTQHMMPEYKTMAGNGRLMSKNVELLNSNTFSKIADVLKNDKFKNISIKDLDLKFEVKDGRVFVKPFDVNLGFTKLNISGDQGIDQTMNFLVKASIPRSELGGAANALINNLASSTIAKGLNINPGEHVNVNLAVGGTFLKPTVKPVFGGAGESATAGVKEQAKAAAEEKIKEAKEKVSQKAKEQADKLIKDAEAEAQKVRDAAKSAADFAKKEGYAAADKVENSQKNPILKAAAKKTADKMRKEADSKADNIISEGNAKADAIINQAKEQAAKL